MNTVVKQIKRCFTIYTALFITLITSRFARAHNCGQQQLVECAKPLSFITESGMTFVSNRTDLERICPDLKGALRCIHLYTRTCMSMQHRRHFKELFHGTSLMVHELCNNPAYQEEYLRYVPCMMHVAEKNQVCFEQYAVAMKDVQQQQAARRPTDDDDDVVDLVEYQRKRKRQIADEGIRNVCCSFREYVDCSTRTTRAACGLPAADFMRNFLDRMSSAMIRQHCSEYDNLHCGIARDADVEAALSTASTTSISITLLATIASYALAS